MINNRFSTKQLSLFRHILRVNRIPDRCLSADVDIVICGGGIAGLSVLYNLLKLGNNNAVLLERSKVGSGTTQFSQGILYGFHLWQHPQVQQLAVDSNAFFTEINATHDIGLDYFNRVWFASSPGCVNDLMRLYSQNNARNFEHRLLSKADLEKLYGQVVDVTNIKTGLWNRATKTVNNAAVIEALVSECKRLGGNIREDVGVDSVHLSKGSTVEKVVTSDGFITCKKFINCAGPWSRIPVVDDAGDVFALPIPAQPVTHSYMVTEMLPGAENLDENVGFHDFDTNVLAFPSQSSNLTYASGFDAQSSKVISDEVAYAAREFLNENSAESSAKLGEDWDNFFPILERLALRFPTLKTAKVLHLPTAFEQVTPDGNPIVGEVPIISNYYVLNGFCGTGLTLAPGAAKLLATWVHCGVPDRDVGLIDAARFLYMHCNPKYLHERVPEIMSLSFHLQPQLHQCERARNVRRAATYNSLQAAGAVFGEVMGYERPLFFDPKNVGTRRNSSLYVSKPSTGRPWWFDIVADEYEACRERLGLIDMSTFAKFEINGKTEDLMPYLQRLCSNNLDREVGATVYTGLQNEHGGYVTDCTVSRLENDRFFVIAPSVQQLRAQLWFERNKPQGSSINVHDVTSMYTAFNLIGPNSKHLMTDLTGQEITPQSFPVFTCREMNVGFATRVIAISVTHCGELGWVLYVPNEFAQHVYDEIIDHGKQYGLAHAGYYTLRNLRIEKFFVYWGIDIDYMTTPFECAREFRIDFNKGDFIGRDALLKQKETGVKRYYVQLLIEDHDLDTDPWPQGQEPIFRNGQHCGHTTSAGYGYTLNCQVCLGYVFRPSEVDENEHEILTRDWLKGSAGENIDYEVEIAGQRFKVKMNLNSPQLPMPSSELPSHYRPSQ